MINTSRIYVLVLGLLDKLLEHSVNFVDFGTEDVLLDVYNFGKLPRCWL